MLTRASSVCVARSPASETAVAEPVDAGVEIGGDGAAAALDDFAQRLDALPQRARQRVAALAEQARQRVGGAAKLVAERVRHAAASRA